jgi:hypothetical protein
MIRLAVAAGVVVAAAVALAAALRGAPMPREYLPPGTNGVVLLDVSASISADTYRRIAVTLDELAASKGRYGLILFSDSAYLALPPGTPSNGLRAFARFFRVPRAQQGGLLARPPRSPWSEQFTAGTRISVGLSLALEVVQRERVSQPAVLLVSDLNTDAADVDRMATVALQFRRARIPLRVVALNAAPDDLSLVTALVGTPQEVIAAPDPGKRIAVGRPGVDLTLVGAAIVCAILLGALIAASQRLRWEAAG